jgi:dihydrofolate reductase
MRKIVVTEYMTLDGVMQDPGGAGEFAGGGWSQAYWSDEIAKVKFDELFASDAMLLGRVTYDGFAAAWPSVTDEAGFADRMNGLPKYVVSTTLTDPSWNNSHVIRENIIAEITALKQREGQDILVHGSGQLVQALIANHLVDRYHLLVYPVVVGAGKRLFKDGADAKLRLIEARSFATGVTLLRYEPTEPDQ